MSKALNTVGYQPNWDNIDALVEEGYIRRVNHPEDAALSLYNYTPKTQYEQHWTLDTLICRGLIARESGGHREVIARPFPKFFNYQELLECGQQAPEHTKGPWQVYEKMDGSLGILYEFAPGDYRIATRGSFTSEQALWATEEFKRIRPGLMSTMQTWLFEIIYPENRIVVDYKGESKLVLLSKHDTATGYYDLVDWYYDEQESELEVVKYHGIQDAIPTDQRENHEGYVLVNDKGFRVKVKHDEYVRLHKILTNTSSRTVWEYLSDPEKDFNELLDNVPDEFYDWVKEVKEELEREYARIEVHCQKAFLQIDCVITPDTRKGYAMLFKGQDFPSILFAMLDNKDYSGIIWKLIKPKRTLPFTGDENNV